MTRTRGRFRIGGLALLSPLAGGFVLLSACGGTESGALSAGQTSKGPVLAGPSGKTLYELLDHQMKPVACSGPCAVQWPPLSVSGAPQAGSGVTATLSTTSSAGNSQQVTADGTPVYYYSGDSSAGDINGEGLNSFSGTWYAVQPSGQPMTSAGASGGGGSNTSSAGSSPSSGGGY